MDFNELIEIHSQEFGRYTEMTSEVETLREVDHTEFIMRILFIWISVGGPMDWKKCLPILSISTGY